MGKHDDNKEKNGKWDKPIPPPEKDDKGGDGGKKGK